MVASIFFQIGILILFAKIFGEVTKRFGLSSLVGEIFAGLLLGPILGIVAPNDLLGFIATIGIMFLVFLIGMETKYEELKKDVYTGSFLAFAGAILSFGAGLMIGIFIFKDLNIGIIIGLAMISTSTAIPIKILIDRNEFHTRVGKLFVVMALADDIIAILSLSLLTSYLTSNSISLTYTISLFFAIMGFLIVVLTFGEKVVTSFLKTILKFNDENLLLAIIVSLMFLGAFLSEFIGIAAILGTFLVGMTLSRNSLKEAVIVPKINNIGYGFVIPIFFAYSALFIDINTIAQNFLVILLILTAGIVTKAIGSGYLARFFGINGKGQRIIAIGMIPRGEYGIVITQLALTAGAISQNVYTILLSFIVLTVILAPIIFSLESKATKNNRWGH